MSYNPIPFDLTYIVYDPQDPIGLICVHLSLFPMYNMVFYLSWFLVTREIEPVVVVGGHLVSEVLNKCAKIILKAPRPEFHKEFGHGSLSFGMPSAHGQHMGFFSAYFICIILLRVNHLTRLQKLIGSITLLVASASVCFSRVYLLYHTYQQVIVGTILGSFLGVSYYFVSSILRDIGLVDWVLGWPIVRYFYVKDSYFHVYQTYEEEFEHYSDLRIKGVQLHETKVEDI